MSGFGHSPLPQPPDVFDSASYVAFIREQRRRYDDGSFDEGRRIMLAYRARLPVHLLARCPFCGTPVAEPVDTFSLNGLGWGHPNEGFGWSSSLGTRAKEFGYCDHVRIVSFFLNLEGRVPDDLLPGVRIRFGPEVPSIMRVPMRADDAIAVMHALPVGRLSDERAEHRHTLYFLSYFFETADSYAAATAGWKVHHGPVDYEDVDYDLAAWAGRGRLRWLDTDDPSLPLVGVDTKPFPYGDIEGNREALLLITPGRVGPWPERRPGLLSRLRGLFGGRE